MRDQRLNRINLLIWVFSLIATFALSGTLSGCFEAGGEPNNSEGLPEVTQFQISHNTLILGGKSLQAVKKIQLNGGGASYNFRVIKQGPTFLTAHATRPANLVLGTAYSLLLSNANADSASPITLSLPSNVVLADPTTGNVGIRLNSFPPNALDVNGTVAIGSYAGVYQAPTNGLIVSGIAGIGTQSPQFPLDIYSSTMNQAFIRVGSSGGAGNSAGLILAPWIARSANPSSEILAVDDGNFSSDLLFLNAPTGTPTSAPTEVMRITSLGNVGIGSSSPQAMLEIQSGSDGSGLNGSNIAIGWHGGGYRHWIKTKHENTVATENNGLEFYINSSTSVGGSVAPGTGNNFALGMYGNGNVGIGTTTPSQQLHITKNVFLPSAVTNTSGNLFFGGDTSLTNQGMRMFALDSLGGGFIDVKASTSSKGIIFRTDTVDATTIRMAITAGGNVGIGTASPGFPLEVDGATPNSDPGTMSTGNFGNYSVGATPTSGYTGKYGSLYKTAVAVYAPSGDVVAVGFDALSDRRLKKEIQEITPETALRFVRESEPVHFKWKESGKPSYGFIAQDLIQMGFSDLVSPVRDPKSKYLVETVDEKGVRSPEGFKLTVNYSQLIALITQALKYLDSDIQGLKESLNIFKNESALRLQAVEAENAKLKSYLCSKDPAAEVCH